MSLWLLAWYSMCARTHAKSQSPPLALTEVQSYEAPVNLSFPSKSIASWHFIKRGRWYITTLPTGGLHYPSAFSTSFSFQQVHLISPVIYPRPVILLFNILYPLSFLPGCIHNSNYTKDDRDSEEQRKEQKSNKIRHFEREIWGERDVWGNWQLKWEASTTGCNVTWIDVNAPYDAI